MKNKKKQKAKANGKKGYIKEDKTKIINKRLFWYLETEDLLSPFQYGFRKNRNTDQAFLELQSQIKEAFSYNSSQYSVFLDLQEAFFRVWRHYIITRLHEIGLRGNLPSILPSILQNFLHDRNISVPPQSLYKTVFPRTRSSASYSVLSLIHISEPTRPY